MKTQHLFILNLLFIIYHNIITYILYIIYLSCITMKQAITKFIVGLRQSVVRQPPSPVHVSHPTSPCPQPASREGGFSLSLSPVLCFLKWVCLTRLGGSFCRVWGRSRLPPCRAASPSSQGEDGDGWGNQALGSAEVGGCSESPRR